MNEYIKFFNFIELSFIGVGSLLILSYLVEKSIIYYLNKIKRLHHRSPVYENIKDIFTGHYVVTVNVFYFLIAIYIPIVVLQLINYLVK